MAALVHHVAGSAIQDEVEGDDLGPATVALLIGIGLSDRRIVKLLKLFAQTKRQLRDVGGKVESTAQGGIMAGLTGYLDAQFKQREVPLSATQMSLVRDTYAARVRAQGFELSKEPPSVSTRILDDIAAAFVPSKVSPKKAPASPDTTSRRGAPLKVRHPSGERKSVLTKADILAELRAGNL